MEDPSHVHGGGYFTMFSCSVCALERTSERPRPFNGGLLGCLKSCALFRSLFRTSCCITISTPSNFGPFFFFFCSHSY